MIIKVVASVSYTIENYQVIYDSGCVKKFMHRDKLPKSVLDFMREHEPLKTEYKYWTKYTYIYTNKKGGLLMPFIIAYDDLTPEAVRTMDEEELIKLIRYAQTTAVDIRIVQDLIRDRNDMRNCYNKLYEQLQDLGVEPCIDYFNMGKTGRPKSKKKPGNKSKSQKKRRKVTNKNV